MVNAQNNYYNIQLLGIHLVPSLRQVTRHTIYKNLKNEMWNHVSWNFQVRISSVHFVKFLQYKTATFSTYTIMYPISTLKKWVIKNYVAYKKSFYTGEIMRVVKKYL
jgi:hypothetical protein